MPDKPDIVQEMIRHGATDFDTAMEAAARGGHDWCGKLK
jgi:hypothetical protein